MYDSNAVKCLISQHFDVYDSFAVNVSHQLGNMLLRLYLLIRASLITAAMIRILVLQFCSETI